MDESHVLANWKSRDTGTYDHEEVVRGNPSKGQRVIIVHVITKDGSSIAPDLQDPAGFPKREGCFRESGTLTTAAGHGRQRGPGGCSDRE